MLNVNLPETIAALAGVPKPDDYITTAPAFDAIWCLGEHPLWQYATSVSMPLVPGLSAFPLSDGARKVFSQSQHGKHLNVVDDSEPFAGLVLVSPLEMFGTSGGSLLVITQTVGTGLGRWMAEPNSETSWGVSFSYPNDAYALQVQAQGTRAQFAVGDYPTQADGRLSNAFNLSSRPYQDLQACVAELCYSRPLDPALWPIGYLGSDEKLVEHLATVSEFRKRWLKLVGQ